MSWPRGACASGWWSRAVVHAEEVYISVGVIYMAWRNHARGAFEPIFEGLESGRGFERKEN